MDYMSIAFSKPFLVLDLSTVPPQENDCMKVLDLCNSSLSESKLNVHYPCQLKDEQRKWDPATPPCEDRSNVDQREVHDELGVEPRGGVQPAHLASKLETKIRRQRPSQPRQGKSVMTKQDQPDKAAAVQGNE
jgi:hypothetical protein